MKKKSGHNLIKGNRGAAMMIAIVIIGIIMVFAFSLLLVSYTLYASQNKKATSLRCSETANTLSVAIADELEDDDACKISAIWKYLRCNSLQGSNSWPYYEVGAPGHGETEAFRYFDLNTNGNYKAVEGFPGSVKLCIYWTVKDDKNVKQKLQTQQFEQLSMTDRSGAVIHIEVIAESGSQTYTVDNAFEVAISEIEANSSESKLIKSIAETKYPETNDYIYNPMDFKTLYPTDTTASSDLIDKPIFLNEKWTLKLISRE